VPLDSCGADTQGAIGYQIQLAMYNCMRDWPDRRPVATVVTQVLVDGDDPAFQRPTKPIGSFLDRATAEARRDQYGWQVVEDAGRGFRRVVASPAPREILELDAIQALLAGGFVVVAAGGGGIPVRRTADGSLTGVEAVIDKDFASGLLARCLGADVLLISTAVERVCLDFGKPGQRAIDHMTVAEARRHVADGQFAPGSMRPKIEASIDFVTRTGATAVITDPGHLLAAIDGQTGTRITP
jgi:carbamate kinase